MFHELLASFFKLILLTYFQLHLWWLRLNNWIVQRKVAPTGGIERKIAVIGDGLAEGCGDWVVFGHVAGLVKPLETEIGKKAPLFRLNWHVVTWGVTGAISSDWLPSLGTATYFDETFPMSHDRRTTVGDADLVVLLLGGEDFRDTLMMADEPIDVLSQRTVDNIAAIAKELLSRGKSVCLCDILMCERDEGTRWEELGKEQNRKLRSFARTFRASDSEESKRLSGPVSFHRVNSRDNTMFDRRHFNSTGYQTISRVIVTECEAVLKRIEWIQLRNILEARNGAQQKTDMDKKVE